MKARQYKALKAIRRRYMAILYERERNDAPMTVKVLLAGHHASRMLNMYDDSVFGNLSRRGRKKVRGRKRVYTIEYRIKELLENG